MSRTAWIVGGVSTIGACIAALFVNRKAKETEDTIKNAVEGLDKAGAPILPAGSGVTVPVRITGYWPFTAKTGERKMEGGVKDRLGYPLHTLEEFQSGKAPYVAVSGDDAIWPYGQRISLSDWPGVTFRIVDTGDHFSSYKDKVFRAAGHEPLDVCVDSSSTHVVAIQDATIYPGDDYKSKDKRKRDPKEVVFQKIGKPTAVGYAFGAGGEWGGGRKWGVGGFEYDRSKTGLQNLVDYADEDSERKRSGLDLLGADEV